MREPPAINPAADGMEPRRVPARKTAWQICFGIFFMLAGCNHFLNASDYARIIPPILPFPEELVYVSGLCEFGLGLLLLTRWQHLAAWGLIALLVAVFPANVHMALHPEAYPEIARWLLWLGLPFPESFRIARHPEVFEDFAVWLLWARLPMQALLIWWAHAYTGQRRSR